jgi:large subunit ribosomal protein L21
MFAVIKAAGKQFRVAANDEITTSLNGGNPGDTVTYTDVMTLTDGETVTVGTPYVAGATVVGEIMEHARGPKVIAFKKRRRQNSKRKRGYRDELTVIRITEILTGGAKPTGIKAKREAPAAASAALAGAVAMTGAAGVSGGLDASNLSLISGIGPTIEKKLRAAGVTSWNEIAAWTDADLAKWDEELKLRGRATREEWVVQAAELLAGKPPRAKVDQAEQASGKDL